MFALLFCVSTTSAQITYIHTTYICIDCQDVTWYNLIQRQQRRPYQCHKALLNTMPDLRSINFTQEFNDSYGSSIGACQ